MLIRREVYFSAYDEDGEERLYSTTELISEENYIQKEFGKGDKKGKAKKKAAKFDRQATRERYKANAGMRGISEEQALRAAELDMKELGPKAGAANKSASQLANPIKTPGSTPKQTLGRTSVPKRKVVSSNLPTAVENKMGTPAKKVVEKTTERVSTRPKNFNPSTAAEKVVKEGMGKRALGVLKRNKKLVIGTGVATLTTGGGAYAYKKYKK